MDELLVRLGFSKNVLGLETAMTREFPLLDRIMEMLPQNSFCLIGGGAVVLHVGKHKRVISPDLDLLVNPVAFEILSKNFKYLPNRFGITLVNTPDDPIDIDVILAKKMNERLSIKDAVVMTFSGRKLPVISVPNLIVMKMLSGREKDEDDAILLIKEDPTATQIAKLLLKRYKPDLVDDLKSLVMLANLVK